MKLAMKRINRGTTVLAAGASVLLVALSGGVEAQAPASYKFGLAMPLSGSQALYGADQVKAAQWAVDAINAKGGINGKKLEMITLDT
ncbi:MAG TPA: ABC transporter substrate-binding protein, partial [Hyphomicrobiaceae bacterium]|nr:ABC transporter substrate-binding protein [Hyphomicrobiaceae bacterium]